MSKMWMNSGIVYDQIDSNYTISDNLPVGIYNIQLTRNGFHLEKYADKFIFAEKYYGLQENFINHVIKTYNNTEGNLGIIFNGVKGTGKTYTAKELVNKLNLPTIIVKDMGDNNQSMVEFLSSIDVDCIFFLDEFEKNFDYRDPTILQIMDGVYNTKFRKIFLLTTNSLNINDNLLGRPSRIKYVKTFGNLDLKIVNEYLDDHLKVPEARQELFEYINTLRISTIDILKNIVTEINIHGKDCLSEIKSFFNVQTNTYDYTVIQAEIEINKVVSNKEKYSIKKFIEFANNFDKNIEQEEIFKYPFIDIIHHYDPFDKLEIGNCFGSDSIIAIDEKSQVIVTECGNILKYYLVKKVHTQNSIYQGRNTIESLIL